jgi:hypothetical protein
MNAQSERRNRVFINWRNIRHRFSLFDKTGLEPDTIRILYLVIAGVMGGVVWGNITGGIAMTGYMKELGASDFVYGLVIAMSPLANAFQFIASYWMEKTLKRKQMFLVAGFIQRVIWLPFAVVPFIVPMSQPQLRLWSCIVCVIVSAGMAPFMNVSLFSMWADVIPMRIRARYFATRSSISTFVGLIIGIVTGVLLDGIPGFTGYAIVFSIAAGCGIFDICCFIFMKMPPMKKPEKTANVIEMMKRVLKDRAYMKIVLSMTLWCFAVQLAAPYFNVYMRDNMLMTNLQITIYGQVISSILLIAFVGRWARSMDAFGDKPVLRASSFLTAFMPFLFFWAGKDRLYMAFVANALSGATYCAIDISAQNLFMGKAQGENKSMYFAVYFIFTQLFGLSLGSTAGGWLLDNVLFRLEDLRLSLIGVPLSRYNWLFLISWILRVCVSLLIMPTIVDPESKSVSFMLESWRRGGALQWRQFRNALHRKKLRRKMETGGDE